MSSCDGRSAGVCPVAPGGCLVVAGMCLQASVQDADEPVGGPGGGRRCARSRGRAGRRRTCGRHQGEALSAAKAWIIRASMSRSLCTNRAATIFFLPEARVIGLAPA